MIYYEIKDYNNECSVYFGMESEVMSYIMTSGIILREEFCHQYHITEYRLTGTVNKIKLLSILNGVGFADKVTDITEEIQKKIDKKYYGKEQNEK